MKLNSAQVQRTLDQFEARVIPDEDPVIAQLNKLFGERSSSTSTGSTSWSRSRPPSLQPSAQELSKLPAGATTAGPISSCTSPQRRTLS